MIDVSLGFIVSSLPWWVAAPALQLTILVVGMALDETYVNRTTVLTGAIATHVHIFVAGEAGLLVSVYADLGLVVGAYGLYAYVIDGYVAGWFRVLAYFVYSPLSAFLVILTAGPTLFGVEPLFVPALALAGYGNVRLREYLRPEDPYYFGPESQDAFEAVLEAEADGSADREAAATGAAAPAGSDPSAATATATDSGTGAGPGGAEGSAPTSETAAGAAAGGAATAADTRTSADGATASPPESQSATAAPVDEPGGDGADIGRQGAEPAAADASERGILPKFMRRL